MPGIREKKGEFDKHSLATSSSFTASIIGGDNNGNKMQSKLKGIMERLKQKREERGGALSEESNDDDDDDQLDKDEEEIMRVKLQEIQLKAANKLRRRSTIVMGAKSMSPKAVKK
jgi:hypothetical protein